MQAGALCLAAAGAELFAARGLGLGDPPLLVPHPTLEYLPAPSQACQPFGNVYRTNRYGMRSGDFWPVPVEGEFRVLLYGDSVLNGGNPTDQPDLASERLAAALRSERGGR